MRPTLLEAWEEDTQLGSLAKVRAIFLKTQIAMATMLMNMMSMMISDPIKEAKVFQGSILYDRHLTNDRPAGDARVLVWEHPRTALGAQDQEELDGDPGDDGHDDDLDDKDEAQDEDCKRTFWQAEDSGVGDEWTSGNPPRGPFKDTLEELGAI